jgi:deacetoxycephalosporin-C synthase/deacetoxycephalosporin-C hydroxylase
VLDLAVLCGEAGAGMQAEALQRLGEAVTGSGFFYLKNHGIAEDAIEQVARQTRSFFSMPEPYKRQFDRHQQIRGYTGYRFESTARFFGTGSGQDLCMKYTMGPELSAEEVRARISSEEDLASNAYSENVYPGDDFRAAWVHYYDAVHRASMALLAAMGQALRLDADGQRVWSEMLIERSCGELRFFQYPDVPKLACVDSPGAGPDRMAAHFDMDVVTLLHQTPCDNGFISLEALIGEEYVKLPAIRGTLVVNLGEILRLLTRGRVKATVHRVVRPPMRLHAGSARDVLVFFQAPPLNARLRPIAFEGEAVGTGSIFDELYRAAGSTGYVRFSQLRARLFGEFIRQMEERSPQAEHEAHLFSTV